MIEKLEEIKSFDCSDTPKAKTQHHIYHNNCIRKINELVDAVNELTEHFADASEMIKAPETTPDIRQKWIGKICKFWDNDDAEDNIEYGVLTAISTDYGVGYCCNDEYEYDNCQPVKPDDDVIYKGSNDV